MVIRKEDKNVLKGLLRASNINQMELAKYLGMGIRTVNRKINNYEKWTVGEALVLKQLLNKKYIDNLFFED